MTSVATVDPAGSMVSTSVQPAQAARSRVLAGAALFGLSALFMTTIMLAASIAPGYDLSGGAISDLGTISETAVLFNAVLVAIGVLNLVAGMLLKGAGGSTSLVVVYVAAGLGAIGAGLVPLDRGDVHGLFALAAFVLFNVEAILSARLVRQPMAGISVLAGLIGLAFVALMAVGDSGNPGVFGPIGHGGAERMIVYPVMLWLLGFGGALMGSASIDRGGGTSA